MHAQTVIKPISMTDYLLHEQQQSIRHEYIDGHLFAMAGGSKAHNQIAMNLVTRIRPHLRGSNCRVYAADMKVKTENCFYYPDVVITCQIQQETAELYLIHPCVLIEVLSPSTEHIDKREKLLAYQRIPSLQTYCIIAQDQPRIEQYWRDQQGDWYLNHYAEQDIISLTCLNLTVTMSEIYEDVL